LESEQAEKLLESLVAVCVAFETMAAGSAKTWALVR
jgi:hypothetical protein